MNTGKSVLDQEREKLRDDIFARVLTPITPDIVVEHFPNFDRTKLDIADEEIARLEYIIQIQRKQIERLMIERDALKGKARRMRKRKTQKI